MRVPNSINSHHLKSWLGWISYLWAIEETLFPGFSDFSTIAHFYSAGYLLLLSTDVIISTEFMWRRLCYRSNNSLVINITYFNSYERPVLTGG